MRNERKILRFVPQKLCKSFANGNPSLEINFDIFYILFSPPENDQNYYKLNKDNVTNNFLEIYKKVSKLGEGGFFEVE